MPHSPQAQLSRRERQIMDVLYKRGEASVAEVREGLPDPPSYSSVRALMGVLVRKGHVKHRQEGTRYVYRPTRPRQQAARSALQQTVRTFFDGSVEKAAVALLDLSVSNLSAEELDRLAALIEQARTEGR